MGAILSFAFSPLGKIIIGVVAFFIWLAAHDAKVANRARGECQSEQLQRTVDELTRQKNAATAAAAEAEKQSKITEAEMAELEKSRDEVVARLQDAGRSSCHIPSDAIDRLRNIR